MIGTTTTVYVETDTTIQSSILDDFALLRLSVGDSGSHVDLTFGVTLDGNGLDKAADDMTRLANELHVTAARCRIKAEAARQAAALEQADVEQLG